jgi:hypothetical protein
VPQRSQPSAYDLGDTVEWKAALETMRRACSLSLRPHQLESRMREIRPSGLEGGVARKRHPYPYLAPHFVEVGPLQYSSRSKMSSIIGCIWSSGQMPYQFFSPGFSLIPAEVT